MRIVIANEPRSYREVLEQTFTALRPHVVVIVAEPDALESVIANHGADLVICSRLIEALQAYPLAWIMLYPAGESHVVISVGGNQTTVADLDLNQLLAIVDQTEQRLADMSQGNLPQMN